MTPCWSPRRGIGSIRERAIPEVARVLRPGGRLGLVWNTRDERLGWVRELGQIIGSDGDGGRFDVTLPAPFTEPAAPSSRVDELPYAASIDRPGGLAQLLHHLADRGAHQDARPGARVAGHPSGAGEFDRLGAALCHRVHSGDAGRIGTVVLSRTVIPGGCAEVTMVTRRWNESDEAKSSYVNDLFSALAKRYNVMTDAVDARASSLVEAAGHGAFRPPTRRTSAGRCDRDGRSGVRGGRRRSGRKAGSWASTPARRCSTSPASDNAAPSTSRRATPWIYSSRMRRSTSSRLASDCATLPTAARRCASSGASCGRVAG